MSGTISSKAVCKAFEEVHLATGVRLSVALRYGPCALEALYFRAKHIIQKHNTWSELRRAGLREKLSLAYRLLTRLMRTRWYLGLLSKRLSRAYERLEHRPGEPFPSKSAFFALHGVQPNMLGSASPA